MANDITFTRSEGAKNNVEYTLKDTDSDGKFDMAIRHQKEVRNEKGEISFGENIRTIKGEALESFQIIKGRKSKSGTLTKENAHSFFNSKYDAKPVVTLTGLVPEYDKNRLAEARNSKKETIILRGEIQSTNYSVGLDQHWIL